MSTQQQQPPDAPTAAPAPLEAEPLSTAEQPKEKGAARQWVDNHWGAISRSLATAAILTMLGMAGTWFDEFSVIWKLPARVATLEAEEAAIDPARLRQMETTVQKLEDAQEQQSTALNDVKNKLVIVETELPYLKRDMGEVREDVRYLIRSRK